MSKPNNYSEEQLSDNPGIPHLSKSCVRIEGITVVTANECQHVDVSLVALVGNSR
jgi:hypothetical protein